MSYRKQKSECTSRQIKHIQVEEILQRKIRSVTAFAKDHEEELNVESFLKLVRKYTDIKELDPEIIRTFVDKIYVEQSLKIKGSRLKKQTIWIYWNFIGKVDI